MFLELIAGIFLVVFLIKILDPILVPGLKRVSHYLAKGFEYILEHFGLILFKGVKFLFLLFAIITESFVKGIRLLFSNTVRVLGIIVVTSIVVDAIITTFSYPTLTNLGTWFRLFLNSFFDVYTVCFFTGIYLYGLYHVIINPRKRLFYFSSNGIHIEELFKAYFTNKKNTNQTIYKNPSKKKTDTRKTVYVYDEEHDEFKKSQ